MPFLGQDEASKEKLLLRYCIVENGAGEKITAFRKMPGKANDPRCVFCFHAPIFFIRRLKDSRFRRLRRNQSDIRKIPNLRHNIPDHLFRHSRIKANPKTVVHEFVRVFQLAGDTVIFSLFQGRKTGVPNQVTGEEISGLDVFLLQAGDDIIALEWKTISQGYQKTEPAWITVGCGFLEHEVLLQISQTVIEELKVFFPLLDKAGEFFKLSAAYCHLHICCLQVVAEMGVNIFVVIPIRKSSILPLLSLPLAHQQSRPQSRMDSPISFKNLSLV